MKIGSFETPNNIFMAPMAGISDTVFRELCKGMGCGLAYTEMVSAKALHYASERTKHMLGYSEAEAPVAVQIFGSEPPMMAEACEYIDKLDGVCLIDINMGCPVPKVVKKGEGVALMKKPLLAQDIVSWCRRSTRKPVTVKIRKGFSAEKVNAVEFALAMQEAGAAAVAVHGRTGEKKYSGKADWDIIRQVKEALKVPVIGNGDIGRPEDALRMLKETGCDGVMVARGALDDPWIFMQIARLARGEEPVKPDDAEVARVFNWCRERSVARLGERRGVVRLRKYFPKLYAKLI